MAADSSHILGITKPRVQSRCSKASWASRRKSQEDLHIGLSDTWNRACLCKLAPRQLLLEPVTDAS